MRVMKLHCGCVVLTDDDGECFTLHSCAYENPWNEDELDISHNAGCVEIKSLKDSFFEDFRYDLSEMASRSHLVSTYRRALIDLIKE